MKLITVESGQNLIDIALQEYGTPEALVTICADNALEYDANLVPDQALAIRQTGVDKIDFINMTVLAEYQKAGLVINSGIQ